jgi:hypothetical protein
MENLCAALALHAASLRISWGWKPDEGVVFGCDPSWVLYVELPEIGQISFHSPSRGKGPEYPGEWDGEKGAGVQRVIYLAARILSASLEVLA